MYKKIVCATDFSQTALDAVRASSAMAAAFGSELVLLHVIEPLSPAPDPLELPLFNLAAYEKACHKNAEHKLAKLIETQVGAGVKARAAVLSGHAAQTIDDYALREEADLIVIATHGMTGWRHYLMGSVAQKVIQHTSLPVLVVRGAVK